MSQLAPILNGFTSVVATRSFDLIQDGVSFKVVVEIGMPIQDVETVAELDWRCPVRFVKGTSVHERRSLGVDSVQALQLALRLVHDEVECLTEDKSCQVLLFDGAYGETI